MSGYEAEREAVFRNIGGRYVVIGLRVGLSDGGVRDVHVKSVSGQPIKVDGSFAKFLTLQTVLDWLDEEEYRVVGVSDKFVVVRRSD